MKATYFGTYKIDLQTLQLNGQKKLNIGDMAYYNGAPIGIVTDISSLDKGNVTIMFNSFNNKMVAQAEEGELPVLYREPIKE